MKPRGDKTLPGGSTVMYFRCHRSGTYQPKPENERKRRLKSIGTQKIGKTCLARITARRQVLNEAMEITVKYQSCHVGHKVEVGRMPLLKNEKNQLAGQLNQGIPKSTILNNLRKSYSPTKRLCLISKKDLHNICRDFRIDQEVIFHQNDAMSVDIKVRKMQNEVDNPVLLYKPIDTELNNYPELSKDEFLLGIMNAAQLELLQLYGTVLMIDSTHGTNQYGFQLTTPMVNDSNHEGFPVAILYSTRVAAETFIPFFEKIKERCPNLKPDVFMSDDAPAFYNAWKAVFGEVKQHLICSWHVVRSWNINLNSKIKSKELRESVRRKLKEMLHETDFNTFKQLSEMYISDFLSCDDTKTFGQYLISHYMNRIEQWAYCCRLQSQVNTNMKLERWHREIKYEEAGGKIIKRLDRSICLVLSAISKKLLGRVISMERSKLTSRVIEIRKRHDRSKEMAADSVIEMQPRKIWAVPSSKATTSTMLLEMYDVAYQKDCNCDIRCQDCNICVHQFSCTCHDYCIRFLICKHIHLVCQHFSFGPPTTDVSDTDLTNDLAIDVTDREVHRETERTAISKQLLKSSSSLSTQEERAALMFMFQSFVNQCETAEEFKVVREGISALQAKVAATTAGLRTMPVVQREVAQEPGNKNVEPQKRMFSRLKLKRKHSPAEH